MMWAADLIAAMFVRIYVNGANGDGSICKREKGGYVDRV